MTSSALNIKALPHYVSIGIYLFHWSAAALRVSIARSNNNYRDGLKKLVPALNFDKTQGSEKETLNIKPVRKINPTSVAMHLPPLNKVEMQMRSFKYVACSTAQFQISHTILIKILYDSD